MLYRLNIIRIKVPALRERAEDVPLLLRFYLEKEAKALGLEEKVLSKEVTQFLASLPWPGNVRQLRSLCTWLTIMAPDKTVYMEDLPLELQNPLEYESDSLADDDWQRPLKRWAEAFLKSGREGLHTAAEPMFEKTLIEVAMQATSNHRQKAAVLLGWGRNTLTRKTQALGMDDD